jgi:O-antigen ligase
MSRIDSATVAARVSSPVLFIGGSIALAAISVFTAYGPQAVIAAIALLLIGYLALRKPVALVSFLLLTGSLSWGFLTGEEKVFFVELGGIDLNGIRLVGVVITFGILLLYKPEGRTQFLTLPSYVLLILFAAISLTYTWNFGSGIRLLSKFLYPYLIFCVLLTEIHDRETLTKVVRVMFWGGVVALLSIPFSTMVGQSSEFSSSMIRLSGGASHRNPFSFSMVCATGLSTALYMILRGKKYLLFSLIGSTVVLLTVTRIAILALVVVMGTLAFQRGFWKGLAFVMIAVVVLLNYEPLERRMFYQGSEASYTALMEEPVRILTDIDDTGRLSAWSAGISEMFLKSPLVGMGIGSSTGIEYELGNRLTVMHSEAIRILAELGLVGAFLCLIAYLSLTRRIIAVKPQMPSAITVACRLAFPSLLIGYLVICMTDNAFDYYTMLGQNIFAIGALAIRSGEIDLVGEGHVPIGWKKGSESNS